MWELYNRYQNYVIHKVLIIKIFIKKSSITLKGIDHGKWERQRNFSKWKIHREG